MNLLIVDDNPVNLTLLKAQLELARHTVVLASTGVEALRMLEQEALVDGVISDILMPEMDGFRLCLELRKSQRHARLPLILYTNTYDSQADRELAQSVGANGYLTKPAPTQEILDALHKARTELANALPAASFSPAPLATAPPVTAPPVTAPAPALPGDEVLRRYNEALVHKLEEKNLALAQTNQQIELANTRLKFQLNLTRSITDTAAVSIFLMDGHGRLTFMNAHAEKTFGFRFSELEGGHLNQAISPHRDWTSSDEVTPTAPTPEQAGRARASNPQVLAGTEDDFVHKDGRAVAVVWSKSFIEQAGDRPDILLTVSDVSERKRVAQALRESEQLAQATLDSMSTHVAILDEGGRIIGTNKAWKQFAAANTRDALAASGAGNYLLACDGATKAGHEGAGQLAAAIRALQGKTVGSANALTVEYMDPTGGTPRWFNVRLTRSLGEHHVHCVIARQEITERKNAENKIRSLNETLEQRVSERTRELNIANRALEAANQELEAFSYSVSHDLRSPLCTIEGFASTLARKHAAQLDERGKDYLERVRSAAKHMDQLIEDLLALAFTSRTDMKRSQVNLSSVGHEITQELRDAYPQRNVQFDIAPDLTAYADPVLTRSVLQNLLGNAAKFSSKKPQGLVEFGCMPAQQGSPGKVFFVRDNGAGFDMEYAGKLFDAFQRLHGRKEFDGTGVGLAIVKRAIQRHGGQVWAQGAPGEGAVLYFTLEADVR